MKIELHLLTEIDALVRDHAAELPQKTELCGAFCGLLALRAAGVPAPDGGVLDQDEVGRRAGVCISADPADGPLPPGEPGRLDYRLAFPTMADEARTGISSTGLARALAELSDGALAVVPVAGPWTAASVEELLRLATAEPGVVCPIGNLATAPLWSAKTETASALRFLRDGDDRGEPSEWQVGHFVGLWGVVAGAAGTLVLVADTYPSLGRNGIHLQPADRVARALERPDGNGGGVLLVVRADRREHTERALVDAGFTLAPWDNGSADQHEDR